METVLITQIVGAIAAAASTVSFAPQAWKAIWSLDVEGLSGGMYMFTVAAFALWLTYGILRDDWALMVPNGLCLALSAFILTMIVVSNRTRARIANAIEHGLQKRSQVRHVE
jgi:MtN3 and saliva related transmembrane protein